MKFVIALTALVLCASPASAQTPELNAVANQRYAVALQACNRHFQPLSAEKYKVAYVQSVNAAEEVLLPTVAMEADLWRWRWEQRIAIAQQIEARRISDHEGTRQMGALNPQVEAAANERFR